MLKAQVARRVPATIVFAGAAAAVLALHLTTNANLGFHTDELYYLDAGRHPAFGYVDFPPIVPLLARLETGILGTTPWDLRVLPTLLGAFMVALSGLYVRRLGGSLRLQALALLIAVTATYFLGSNWVFQTVTFDEATWMVSLYFLLCLVLENRPRNWILLGVSLGVGLEVKFTILGLIAGVGVAILVTPALRSALRTRWPWIAAAIALLIWAPNIAWQFANGLPTLTYVGDHGDAGGGPLSNVVLILVYLFFVVPIWVAGLVSLFRNSRLRAIAIACTLPLVLFVFVGKSYYAVGTVPIAIAQGVMVLSRIRRPRLRKALSVAAAAAAVLQLVVFAKLTLPITPPSQLHGGGIDVTNELFADSVGWDQIPGQIASIYGTLGAAERTNAVVISAYYGVPGAVGVFGGGSLPDVVSPQLSDYYWLPADINPTNALLVDYRPSDVGWMCASSELVGHLSVPFEVTGLEQGAPVTFCHLNAPLRLIWPKLRNFS